MLERSCKNEGLLRFLANPKSHSLTTPFLQMRIFSGFTSLWITCTHTHTHTHTHTERERQRERESHSHSQGDRIHISYTYTSLMLTVYTRPYPHFPHPVPVAVVDSLQDLPSDPLHTLLLHTAYVRRDSSLSMCTSVSASVLYRR